LVEGETTVTSAASSKRLVANSAWHGSSTCRCLLRGEFRVEVAGKQSFIRPGQEKPKTQKYTIFLDELIEV
jgi:hypothetical protein